MPLWPWNNTKVTESDIYGNVPPCKVEIYGVQNNHNLFFLVKAA